MRRAPRLLAVIRKRRILDCRRRECSPLRSAPWPQRAEWINPVVLAATDGASGGLGEPSDARLVDRFRSLMSHVRPTAPVPIGLLASAVSFSAGFGPLIATAGGALLLSPSRRPTFAAAVTLTAVTTAAHKEHAATTRPATEPRAQRRLGRHRREFSAHLITIARIADDRTDDRACGADDVVATSTRQKAQKNTFSDDRQHNRGRWWPAASGRSAECSNSILAARAISFARRHLARFPQHTPER